MITLKNPKWPPSIRKVVSDDRSVKYGVLGTVEDLTKMGFVECDLPGETWMFIPLTGERPRTSLTREGIIDIVKCYKADPEVCGG